MFVGSCACAAAFDSLHRQTNVSTCKFRQWGNPLCVRSMARKSYGYAVRYLFVYLFIWEFQPNWHNTGWPPLVAPCRLPADFGGLPSGPLSILLEWRLFNFMPFRFHCQVPWPLLLAAMGYLIAAMHARPLVVATLLCYGVRHTASLASVDQ